VIGAGTMGHGIAYLAARAGCEVTLVDHAPEALGRAVERIAALLDGGVARGKLTAAEREATAARIATSTAAEAAATGADIVLEAVVEELGAKRRVFQALEGAAPTALLATNTSSLSVAAIAAGLGGADRLVGMHFFNPVPAMRLVEIVPHPGTTAASVERAVAFARELGKETIVVKDSPGFASSRLGVALGLEAMRMLEEGVATAPDIDRAMELGYNHPMGPLKLSDLIGLDVRLAIAEALYRATEEPQFQPPRILRDKVARGELGKKSGKGFYVWGS